MRTFLLAISLFFFELTDGQLCHTIAYYDWSNPVAYQLSPAPLITGYGELSGFLSDLYDGETFYEYDGEYYLIENWADYYYWFIKKYWWRFDTPLLYEYYYITGNDLGMCSYIASHYEGRYYPARILVNFMSYSPATNAMRNDYFIPVRPEQLARLNKRLERQSRWNQTEMSIGSQSAIGATGMQRHTGNKPFQTSAVKYTGERSVTFSGSTSQGSGVLKTSSYSGTTSQSFSAKSGKTSGNPKQSVHK